MVYFLLFQIPSILLSMQHYLEDVQTAELLLPSLNIFTALAETHLNLFSSLFKDLVDILVGWSLDLRLPKNVQKRIKKLFLLLQPYWLSHLAFSVDLLSKFVTDMEDLCKTQSVDHDGHLRFNLFIKLVFFQPRLCHSDLCLGVLSLFYQRLEAPF